MVRREIRREHHQIFFVRSQMCATEILSRGGTGAPHGEPEPAVQANAPREQLKRGALWAASSPRWEKAGQRSALAAADRHGRPDSKQKRARGSERGRRKAAPREDKTPGEFMKPERAANG